MKKFIIITIVLSVFAIDNVSAQFVSASYQHIGNKIPYRVMYPKNYDASIQYPLLVFLHGAGERGNDNEKQLVHGEQFLIDNFNVKYPAIVIIPQCPDDNYWANVQRSEIDGKVEYAFGLSDEPTHSMKMLTTLIDYWLASGKVDTRKVYAGGLSMGGMGTFELLWRRPNTFAAAFPICGGTSIDKLNLYATNTAVWIFHGDLDQVVPVQFSQKAYQILKNLGCDVRYTEYEGVKHNSWDNAFKEVELAPWLFSHSK